MTLSTPTEHHQLSSTSTDPFVPVSSPDSSIRTTCEVCGSNLIIRPLATDCALQVCPTCAHIVRNPKLSGTVARTHAWGGHTGMDHIRLALTWRTLSKHLTRMQSSCGRPLDVLELGYGRGLLLRKMLQAGHHVTGVERHLLTDEAAFEIAGAILHNETAETCTLVPESYDVIYAIHVVEHLTDPLTVFRKVAMALRPGGIFYCITPNAESYGLSLFRHHWWNLEDPTHYRFFSQRSLRKALSLAGLTSVNTRIVREDSLTLEVNSALRALSSGDRTHGILHTTVARAVSIAAAPFAVLARAFVPQLSPSIDAIAIKCSTPTVHHGA